MGSRILVAAILIPLVFWILLMGELMFLAGVCVVIGVSLYEFYKMIEGKDKKIYKKTGILIGLAIPIFYYTTFFVKFKYEKFMFMMVVLTIIYLITREILKGEIKEAIKNISYTLFGILYISLLFSHTLFLKNLSDKIITVFGFNFEEGRLWVLTVFLMVWASDSAAYFIGIAIGKNKILPKISPKKSVEGSIAGLLAPIVAIIIVKQWYFHDLQYIHCVAIGLIVGIFGQLGDFGESLFKREYEIKDSGSILMGHGGMWDRFDSLIFVMPLVYYYVKMCVL